MSSSSLKIALMLAALAAVPLLAQSSPEDDDPDEPVAKPGITGLSFQCGVERWSVKTLSDADASKVALNTPQESDIPSLIGNPSSSPWGAFSSAGGNRSVGGNHQLPPDQRNVGGVYDETKVYALTAYVLRYKMENDRDMHIVIADPSNRGATMIAESVDPLCNGAGANGDLFSQVRSKLNALFPGAMEAAQPPQAGSAPAPNGGFTVVEPPLLVRITGVRFFDHLHHQNGVAPNGVELHPIIDVAAAVPSNLAPSAASKPSTAAAPAANPGPRPSPAR